MVKVIGQSDDIDVIRQLEREWRSGWLSGDADALLALYADNPVVMPWGQPAVFDKEAIRPLYEAVFKEYSFRSETKVVEIETSSDLGYFWCTYRMNATPKTGGKTVEEQGKSLFIVKREHGSWKIARVIDNSDRPPETS